MSGSLFLPATPGEAPPEWTGKLTRVCAWCDAKLGETPCSPEVDGETTHGICDVCVARQLRDLTEQSFAPLTPNERKAMPDTLPRSALEKRELMSHLGEHCRAIIYRIERTEMSYGEHWVWRGGTVAYLSAGLRILANAFDHEHDEPSALVCRREAQRLDDRDAADAAKPPPHDPAADAYAQLERRGLA